MLAEDNDKEEYETLAPVVSQVSDIEEIAVTDCRAR